MTFLISSCALKVAEQPPVEPVIKIVMPNIEYSSFEELDKKQPRCSKVVELQWKIVDQVETVARKEDKPVSLSLINELNEKMEAVAWCLGRALQYWKIEYKVLDIKLSTLYKAKSGE